ncbi:unnamed protein product, partial [Effrenium voratum]
MTLLCQRTQRRWDSTRTPGAGPGARAYLEMLKVTDLELDPSTGSDMLISACRTGDLEAAEFWLNKCRALKLQPSEQAYRALVDLAARKSTRQTAERLAAEAEKAQLALGPSYSSLAVAACEEGDLPSAVAWLRRGKPRTAALNQVLKLAIDRGDLALAEQCFGEAVAGGTKPDATTFRSFTSACAAAGELEAAEAWVRRCRAEGLQPDKGSFNSLVRGCVKRGDHLAAGRWYKKAEEQGFEPSVALLGSVLRCAAFKDLAFARQMLDYVLGRGTVPDVQTFNSLVSAAQQAKDPKAAEGFLNLAVQHGVRPEVSAFDALIALSAEAADLPQAEKWLARMGKVGLRPSQASFAGLVDAAARMGDLSMAVYWYEEALKVGIQMDGQTYANLVLAAELQGDDAEAKKWFRLACQRQATIKASFVEKLLSILMDRGEMAVARNWLKRAREAGIDCNGDTLCGLFRELMRACAAPRLAMEIEPCAPTDAEHVHSLQVAFPFRGYIEETELRAISPEQLAVVLSFAQEHCRKWHDFNQRSKTCGKALSLEMLNLYHLTAWVIIPATQERNCAMVELLSEKSQVPEWFVSHWWGEPIVAFHRCVELHRKIRDLPDTVGYWVCAYANRQHALKGEVTADPRETSFFRALQLSKGVLLILDEATADSGPATPFTRIWCAFEEFVALRRGERRLLDIAADSSVKTQLLTEGVAPADEEEARKCGAGYPAAKVRSDREKSFPLEVLKAGLTLQLERAQASEESDRWHILNCIAGRGLDLEPLASHPSYERVNRTLRAIFAVAGWRQAVELDIAEALGLPEVLRADEEREQLVLDFTGSQGIGDRHAAQLGAALAPGLRDLELSCRWCTEVSHEFLVQLAPSLRTLTSLLRLKLGFGFAAKRVQPVGVEALANALPRSLKELFLDFNDGNSLGDESLQAIALRMPPELEILTLCMAGWVHLGDLGLVALARSLPSTLRRLTLDCFILSRRPGIPGDQGLASLAAGWPQLEVLDLSFKSNCKIGDAGLAALVLPRSLKSLRLVLDGCENLSDRGLAALGANLPPGLERLRLFCNETGCGDPSLAGLLLPASLRHLELGFGSAAAADRGLSSLRLPEALSLLSLSLPGSFLDGAGLA